MKRTSRSDRMFCMIAVAILLLPGIWWWWNDPVIPLVLVLVWGPWPLLAAYAQHQRGGNAAFGLIIGLAFGPLGLLVANYSGGSQKQK